MLDEAGCETDADGRWTPTPDQALLVFGRSTSVVVKPGDVREPYGEFMPLRDASCCVDITKAVKGYKSDCEERAAGAGAWGQSRPVLALVEAAHAKLREASSTLHQLLGRRGETSSPDIDLSIVAQQLSAMLAADGHLADVLRDLQELAVPWRKPEDGKKLRQWARQRLVAQLAMVRRGSAAGATTAEQLWKNGDPEEPVRSYAVSEPKAVEKKVALLYRGDPELKGLSPEEKRAIRHAVPTTPGTDVLMRLVVGEQRPEAWLSAWEIALLLIGAEIEDAPLNVVHGRVKDDWKAIKKRMAHASEVDAVGSQGDEDESDEQG